MRVRRDDGHEIDSDGQRLDTTRVHRWLSTDAYWALGRSEQTVARSIEHSTSYGVYDPRGRQVGFARVVTDEATYAWLCDVYVDRGARGLGLGTWLARSIVADLRERGVPRILLATADAHEIYRRAGFAELAVPARWMEIDERRIAAPGGDVAGSEA